MTLKIIKKGSDRPGIRPFFYADGTGAIAAEQSLWPPENLVEATDAVVPATPDSEEAAPEAEPVIDVEQIEKEAYQRGYAAGRTEGEQVAAQQMEAALQRYADSCREIAGLKPILRAQVEEEVVRLALAVAKKLVYREIHIDPTIMQTMVRVALDRVAGNPTVTVRLSQRDYEYMAQHQSETSHRDIVFTPDHDITPGSCLIQTDSGDIDARIEEEFREVESAFFEGMK